MTNHLIEINMGDTIAFWASPEYATILFYLKEERKTLCLFYEDEIKIVDDDELFKPEKVKIFRNNTTLIIDRNLLISARDIFKTGKILEKRHKFFCALMYYGMSIDCLYDPVISIYEGGDRYQNKAIEDIAMFRIIDNLKPQILMDLLFGKIEVIPDNAWSDAKEKVKEIDEKEKQENYSKDLTLFKYNYPYMLKTAQILRKNGLAFKDRVNIILNWAMDEFLMKQEAFSVSMYCFKENGGILKKYRTENYVELISKIKNATWDATLISYLKQQVKKNKGMYYVLVSEDNNLLNAARYFFTPEYENEVMKVMKLINNANQILNDNNRVKIIEERLKSIDTITKRLEKELKGTCTT